MQVLECHVFICKSVEAAMALVQATSYAFEHREGWMSEGCLPPAQIGSAMTFGRSVGLVICRYTAEGNHRMMMMMMMMMITTLC